ncbi:hypothetical protein BABINDRAFT_39306 [Babjeviella inositovora NRRL Y-12698]|uniref:AMP-dependent synthetase/ligase domain-containing protein n=1 Tax=Babjeviella inositovora NRRL Y-12698 TaxID=984486 RepID=A0A1E3QLL5_9ASCO|nr:uncharacterized protein BABINDRAFT_39306 [Babjeviella inositovora NRRL Y-12698]ODQ78508.1 hypothetical protein BABINDRAFT_39306 [Babjeviella inositovora NRRL Y-12698]
MTSSENRGYPATFPPQFDYQKSSIQDILTTGTPFNHNELNGLYTVPGTSSDTGSPIFRNKICAKTPNHAMITSLHPELTSVYDYLRSSMKKYLANRCFASRDSPDSPYWFRSYAEVVKASENFGAGLMYLIHEKLHLKDHQLRLSTLDDFVLAISLPNSYEWFITDLGCIQYSITNTSLYDTLSRAHIEYILGLTKSPVMVLSHDKILPILTTIYESKLAFMKILVVSDRKTVDNVSSFLLQLADDLDISVYTFAELSQIGAERPVEHIAPEPNSIYTLSFTSGTVGNPKGVVLTHQNAVAGLVSLFSAATKPKLANPDKENSKALCVLPLSHVYQRLICVFEMCIGSTIYLPYDQTDARQIMADLYDIKPTHLVGVPRIFSRVEAGISHKIQNLGWVTRFIHDRALAYKKERFFKDEQVTNHWLYDKRFVKKVRAALGLENLQLLVTGSALILPDTIRKLRSLLNAEFVQGYGLTESFATITISFNEDEFQPVSTGYMCCTVEFKLVDCPEIGFSWEKNRAGQIFLRGPQIALEYYKDPEKTAENFDSDGWMRTGDVARLDSAGRIQIVDRVKNMIPLSLGECISPEQVENIYLQTCLDLLSQIYVYGTSTLSFLVGVLVLNEAVCLDLFQESYIPALQSITYMDETNQKELNLSMKVKQFILAYINKKVMASKMVEEYQQVKNIYLNNMDNNGFTVANDLLTPTMKVRRHDAQIFFDKILKRLLEEDITG